MQFRDGTILFSPSDLGTYMTSSFASHMERQMLDDPGLKNLIDPDDPMLSILQKKGYEHEDAFFEDFKEKYEDVRKIERASPESMRAQTHAAMSDGAEVIAQAYLNLGNFAGHADFLVKVPGKSKFGDYQYDVWDTKLARKAKPYFAIQLCCYAEILEPKQGIRPENVFVALGSGETKSLRVQDYFAYYRALKSSFLAFQESFDKGNAPDPADNASHGRWSKYAQKILAERRDLSLVANITRSQTKRLQAAGIDTIDQLATTKDGSIRKLNDAVFGKLKDQAALQIASEGKKKPIYNVLPHSPEAVRGLSLVPPHSPSDLFFDLEGYPLIEGGLEYLWGATYFDEDGNRTFRDFWAHDHAEERQAFIGFVDWAFERWQRDPTMHVYHYASYEMTALRRLMGHKGTHEHKVDTFLRNHVFVDLYNVVSQGIIVGEPSYSIKNIERLYRDKRETEVTSGGDSIVVYEEWRNQPDGMTWQTSDVLNAIRDYNIDDCDSTQELTEWLRNEQRVHGIEYAGPEIDEDAEIPEEDSDTARFRDQLLARAEAEDDADRKRVLKNLAWLLEFHNRENKPTWWKLFERLGKTEADLHDDMDCLAGLRRTSTEPYLQTPRARNKVYEYAYDVNQQFKGHAGMFYVLGHEGMKVESIGGSLDDGLVSLKYKDDLPERISLIPDGFVNPKTISAAIHAVAETLVTDEFPDCAITDFLFRRPPRFSSPRSPIVEGEGGTDGYLRGVIAAANALDNSCLCIQGPPGAGKTYTAKHIIGDLLAKRRRVGISSNSHSAIINLMKDVSDLLLEEDTEARLIKVGGDKTDPVFGRPNVEYRGNPKACVDDARQAALCIGGTAWFFSNPLFSPDREDGDPIEPFDYLFVDEAGQVSMANLVAMSRSCRNIILMGDQMQLGQPTQGTHPDESGQSALEYLLQGQVTIAPDMGIFLPKTFRMHPDVCEVISNQVYNGRLDSDSQTLKHVIDVKGPLVTQKSGIKFFPVPHEGNTQGSEEEVALIRQISEELIGNATWPQIGDDPARKLTWDDILFVAPYNYQVNLLKTSLGPGALVGSVDRFQGKEAPVVIISMCASDASESPRGIDFLFSKNRLNVAISRAQALAIVVGSPRLATTPVNNLNQMELVNFFAEVASY